MEKVDIVIVGAGVVGLAVAAKVSRPGLSVFILERHETFGQETSSRNSEVIHAGIYYPNGSLKAKLCVEGNGQLYDICSKNKIPYQKLTKIIIATDKQEEEELSKLFAKGKANGSPGLELISKEKVSQLEPNIKALSGLWSPFTGIIDAHSLMKYYLFKAKENGAEVVYDSCVTKIVKDIDGYQVSVKDNGGEIFVIKAQVVVNCAGLDSDTVAEMSGIDPDKNGYRLKYCKGHYFRISSAKKCALINRLVYPVPHEKSAGLGVHVTKDLAGGVRLGPDTLYVDRNNFDYQVDEKRKAGFFQAASKFLPFLERDDLIPDTSGMRPKLQGEGEGFKDFIIREESDRKLPGLINLIGIESPGLTASWAIAEYVKKLISL